MEHQFLTERGFRLTRRDMETYLGRFWRYENAQITLLPVDTAQPSLGGKVKVRALIFDWRTFTVSLKNFYGVYSEDFLTFGEYEEGANPLENEELLLKICDEKDAKTVPNKFTFKFENNALHYERDVNGEVLDPELEHAVPFSKLTPLINQTWSETLFYGLGNKSV
jgi:hypothetical protein